MADNFAQFSEFLVVPEGKQEAVDAFFDQYSKDIDDGQFDFFGGVDAQWSEENGQRGIWIYAEENFMDEELLYVVQGLLKAIETELPFYVNIAYWCSKPRIGEFSGGCYVIWQDATYYVDPYSAASEYVKFHDGKPE